MRFFPLLGFLMAIVATLLDGQVFPGRAATAKDLGVATDSVSGVLLANMSATDLVITVSNSTSFVPYNFPVVDGEKFEVCSVTASTLTICPGTRGFDGTTAMAHGLGALVTDTDHSSYHNRSALEIAAIETAIFGGLPGAGSGNCTIATPCTIAQGGTGANTSTGAFNNLQYLPSTGSPTTPISPNFVSRHAVYPESYGAVVDNPNVCNETAIMAADADAALQGGTGYVMLAAGVYNICNGGALKMTHSHVYWVGQGPGQPPEFAPLYGTVLQAGSQWNSTSSYPNNSVITITGTTDLYYTRFMNLTVDCDYRTNCIAANVMHANEGSGFDHVRLLNFSVAGFYFCGALNGSLGCKGYSVPGGGGQGAGPFFNFEANPDAGASSATVPIIIDRAGDIEVNNFTIATYDNTQAGGTHQPKFSVMVSGDGVKISRGHIEGPQHGVIIGPTSADGCTQSCGAPTSRVSVDHVDLTRWGTATPSYATWIDANGAADVLMHSVEGGGTCSVFDNTNYKSDCEAHTLNGTFHTSLYVNDAMGNSFGPETNSVVSGAWTYRHGLAVQTSDTNSLRLTQNYGGFLNINFHQDSLNNLLIDSDAGGNLLFRNPYGVFGLYNGTIYSGVNLQQLNEAATNGTRGAIWSNTYWNHASANLALAGNGGNDYGGILFTNAVGGNPGGLAFTGAAGLSSPFTWSSMPHVWDVSDLGYMGLIASGIIGQNTSANTDMRGEASISSATNLSIVLAGTYTIHPECWVNAQFDMGSGNRIWTTYPDANHLQVNFSTATTGTLTYGCTARSSTKYTTF